MKSKTTIKPETIFPTQETVIQLPVADLYPFPNHPYGVRDDPAMLNTVSSIRQSGVLVPAIVRPREGGGYELISGHRRHAACERLDIPVMPCIVRNLSDDEAIVAQLGEWAVEEDYEDMLRKYALLDDYGKSAVDSVLRMEFNRAQEQGTLNSSQSISVSVRSRTKAD